MASWCGFAGLLGCFRLRFSPFFVYLVGGNLIICPCGEKKNNRSGKKKEKSAITLATLCKRGCVSVPSCLPFFSPGGAALDHPGGEVSHGAAVGQADPPAEETGPAVPQAAEELRRHHGLSAGRLPKAT